MSNAFRKGAMRDALRTFQPRHATFVGVDSDGCVFDTMEVKQVRHFHPLIVRYWGLEEIEAPVRRAAEFINLYSRTRGQNRFVNLLKLFEALPEVPGVRESGVHLPACDALAAYVHSGKPLGNPSLANTVEATKDPELKKVLDWSRAINRDIRDNMAPIPPFGWAEKSLRRIAAGSDMVVVSQTPEEALHTEWERAELSAYPALIAGQELGTKTEHLRLAAGGRYPPDRILMIGDAPGDQHAAEANRALFYPVNPGHEEESWQRFHDEAYDVFLNGRYTASYQAERVREFEALLPETPPWSVSGKPSSRS